MSSVKRPITLLVAALGGEGGGVLTDWITGAARRAGFPVQATSIPGVAQRTGATTYYIEIWPEVTEQRPVMCLNPGLGQVDVMIASEFVEAGRAMQNGYVTPDRTLLIASTHRIFAVAEKSGMGDGRFDSGRLFRAAKECARRAVLFDMDAAAKESGSILNAVLLGALAGSEALPLAADLFEAGIRAEGKAVESNLSGFRFGLAHARGEIAAAAARAESAPSPIPLLDLAQRVDALPMAAQTHAASGVKRLLDYQDAAYATLYLDRLEAVARVDAEGKLTAEVARHLALRMSVEDVIRVAQLKLKPERFQAIERETRIQAGQPYEVADFLKPGIEELAGLLPSTLAQPVLRLAEARGWRWHWAMTLPSNRLGGYLRFRLLAALKPWRRRSHRYAQEQAQIEDWLGLIQRAASLDLALAIEIAECARLIKGYGDTYKRGEENYQRIRAHLILPALDGSLPMAQATDAVLQARVAALRDPEGEALTRTLAAFAAAQEARHAAE